MDLVLKKSLTLVIEKLLSNLFFFLKSNNFIKKIILLIQTSSMETWIEIR